MSAINAILASLVEGLLYPFRDLPPLVGLAVVSLLCSTAMLLVVRATSNQARLAAVKRAIQACVYEVRLFNDDARAMLRAMAELVRHNLTYLRLSLVPLLWMMVPLGLLLAHLQFHYGYRELAPGRATLVKVQLHDSSGPAPVLEAPAGIRIETPAMWIPSLREAVWRIVIDTPGDYELTVKVGSSSVTKTITTARGVVRRSPVRPEERLLDQLLYPAERPLAESLKVRSITVTYPAGAIGVLGWDVHWLVMFIVLSTVFAFALRAPFRVVL